jgi:SAM-dependent methyltransferase
MVPQYHWLQDHVIELLLSRNPDTQCVVDLGAGSGIFLERILQRRPESRGVWVDFSPDFHAVAAQRLAPFGNRVQFVRCRLEEPWERQLAEAPDVVCSMSAIHHLESDQKQRLYQRCHAVLRESGWLFNIDEMSTLYEDAYTNTLRYWADHVEQRARVVPPELADYCRAWCAKFDGWKHRNIENRGHSKAAGDDIHEGYIEQMRWLREAGFVEVDLFAKFQLWSVIGGAKRKA